MLGCWRAPAGIQDPQRGFLASWGPRKAPCPSLPQGQGRRGRSGLRQWFMCNDEFSHERFLTYKMIQVEFYLNRRTQILLSRTEQG